MTRQPGVHSRSNLGWRILRIVLILEAVCGIWLVWNVFQAFAAAADEPLGARLSVLLAVLICWVWILITLFGAWKTRAGWVRGSTLTIHVLMFAAAVGVLQGILGEASVLGVALLLLAVVGFIGAILARPVIAVGTNYDDWAAANETRHGAANASERDAR